LKKKSFKILFFDKSGEKITTADKVILILSPAFYWFHKEKLDISPSQAKKIAPSIFEGMIPQGEYSYFVQKVGDEYYFYAYEDAKILKAIQDRGLKLSQVLKVYPAQEVFKDFKEPLAIGEKLIINEDGAIALLPKDLAGFKVKKTDLNSLKLPKTPLPLKTYSFGALSEDLIYKVSIALFVAILLYAAQAFVHKRELAKLSAKEAQIKAHYHLPATTIELKSILSSLQKIQKEQLVLREQIEYILRMPLRPGEYLKRLNFSRKILFEIEPVNRRRAEEIREYLIQKLRIKDLTLSGKTLLVECAK